jgi:beta-propeller uncharacterized protein DUF5122
MTCTSACTGVAPQSNFLLARYATNGDLDTTFNNNGTTRQIDVDYADIGYSLVLQPQGQGYEIVVGGYSASNGGVPYMAGGRVLSNGTGTEDEFKSYDFGTTSVSPGDQAWQLQVLTHDNNKIHAAGFHTKSGGPEFAIIQLCPEAGDSCSGAGPGGSGYGHPPPPNVAQVEPSGSVAPAPAIGPATSPQDSPAPPPHSPVAEPAAPPDGVPPPAKLREKVTDAVFAAWVAGPAWAPWEEDPLA